MSLPPEDIMKDKMGIVDPVSEQEELEVETGKPSKTCAQKTLRFFKNNLLIILLIAALGIGIGVGAAVRSANLDKRDRMYFAFPGDILMRMLKALIIPLVVSSLISGLGGLDAKASGRMGLYAIVYYLTTTLLAVLLGILLVSTIKPGERSKVEGGELNEVANVADSFLDLIRYVCFKLIKVSLHQGHYFLRSRCGFMIRQLSNG